jgi:hypothetical protein
MALSIPTRSRLPGPTEFLIALEARTADAQASVMLPARPMIRRQIAVDMDERRMLSKAPSYRSTALTFPVSKPSSGNSLSQRAVASGSS